MTCITSSCGTCSRIDLAFAKREDRKWSPLLFLGKNSCLGSRQARAGGHLREAAHPLHEHRKRMCDQKNRSYCAAGSLALDLALDLAFPAGAAGVCNEARRARLR